MAEGVVINSSFKSDVELDDFGKVSEIYMICFVITDINNVFMNIHGYIHTRWSSTRGTTRSAPCWCSPGERMERERR
jgi:hypothetical protein